MISLAVLIFLMLMVDVLIVMDCHFGQSFSYFVGEIFVSRAFTQEFIFGITYSLV